MLAVVGEGVGGGVASYTWRCFSFMLFFQQLIFSFPELF